MASERPLLEARTLSKHFETGSSKVEVLKGLNLEIREGERVAVIGASGVGKSTLLHILGTIDYPTSGEVFYRGENIFNMNEKDLASFRNRHIGFVFQFHHLLPEFDPVENIMIPELMAGTPNEVAQKRALELLEKVGLPNYLGRRIGSLSGGEQQRVAVARALIRKPKILLADEPTGNLDTRTSQKLHELLVWLNKKEGLTMVVATHNLEFAAMMHKVYKLQEGILSLLNQVEI